LIAASGDIAQVGRENFIGVSKTARAIAQDVVDIERYQVLNGQIDSAVFVDDAPGESKPFFYRPSSVSRTVIETVLTVDNVGRLIINPPMFFCSVSMVTVCN
jgi:pyrimidine operon attenuation protein/uracil phosphoribosyltransferase